MPMTRPRTAWSRRPPAFQHIQHPPERNERQQHNEGLRTVEVRHLDVEDRERSQRRGKQAGAAPEQAPPQEEQQQYRDGVHECRQRPPGGRQVLQSHLVHERLHQEAEPHKQIDDDGAEWEPVRIERACVLVEQRAYTGDARDVLREIAALAGVPPRGLPPARGTCSPHGDRWSARPGGRGCRRPSRDRSSAARARQWRSGEG